MLKSALIGHRGLIGSTLKNSINFDELYDSSNSHLIAGKCFETVYFCAARAEKWKANANPEDDLRHISQLIDLMKSVKTAHFVLISTVDIYPNIKDVNESTEISVENELQTYGRNRFLLEKEVAHLFPRNSTIVRLPALFGAGLKKNVIFDLMNDNNVSKINPESEFQYYNLQHLVEDIRKVCTHNIPVVNICSEPIKTREIAHEIFHQDLSLNDSSNPVKYDINSLYSSLWGREKYLYSKKDVLRELSTYVSSNSSIR